MTEEPLIYTSKGNVPISSLVFGYEWVDTQDFTSFTETYTDDTGEVVKRSVHVMSKRGLAAESQLAQL